MVSISQSLGQAIFEIFSEYFCKKKGRKRRISEALTLIMTLTLAPTPTRTLKAKLRTKWLHVGAWLPSNAASQCLAACSELPGEGKWRPLVEWVSCIAAVSLRISQARRSVLQSQIAQLRWA